MSGWRVSIVAALTFLCADIALGQDANPAQDTPPSEATTAALRPACGPGWCGVNHSLDALPPWAQRIRDRTVAPASLDDGIWDPSSPSVTIDLLFLYTPTALAAEGSVAGLQRRIDAWVASANGVFSNSFTGVQINLVHVAQANQPETGSIVAALNAFPNLTEVQTLRDNYQADVVFLLVEQEAVGFFGIAPVGPPGGHPSAAFGALRRFAPDYHEDMGAMLAHELGHILGATHDREHAYDSNQTLTPGAFPYSFGHRFTAGDIVFRDVMSYDPGVLLPYFSNPRITYAGQPLGVPAGQTGEADVTQTITRMADAVSRYRTANSRVGFSRSSLSVSEADPHFTVELQRVGDLSTATRVTLSFPQSSSAKVNLDYRFPSPLTVSFATGQATATVQVPLVQDDLVEGDESIVINLTAVQGQHGLAQQSSLSVTLIDDEPSFTLVPGAAVLSESNGEAIGSVRFSGPLADGETRTLDLVAGVTGDTATPGVDYEVTPATLTFTHSDRVQSFRVRALPDSLVESDETLRLTMGSLTASLRIADADRPGAPLPFGVESTDGAILDAVALPNGHIALAGNFSQVNGTARSRVAVLNGTNGLASSFQPPHIEIAPQLIEGMVPAWGEVVVPSLNGGWWVGGVFGAVGDQVSGHLIRLRPDGTLDPTFRSRINGRVVSIHEQHEGKVLVGGWFTETDGRSTRGLVRLNSDGTFDSSFRLEPGPDGRLASFANAIEPLPGGKILLGGYLETYNRTQVSHLVRIHADGTLDTSFPLTSSGVNNPVNAIRALPDGRVYVTGFFTAVGGRTYRSIARLASDGAVDSTFRNPRPNGEIWDVLPLPNGQVLVAGAFTQIGGVSRRYLALLNEDGTVDPAFDPGVGPSDHCYRLTALADGSALVTGGFTSFGAQPAPGIARVRLPAFTGSFAGIQTGTNGAPVARVWGIPGSRLTLKASPDLQSWAPVAEITVSTLDGLQSIPLAPEGSQRFFRIQ